jgi:hypothetical protein
VVARLGGRRHQRRRPAAGRDRGVVRARQEPSDSRHLCSRPVCVPAWSPLRHSPRWRRWW